MNAKTINNQKGIILPLVLLFVVVSTILGLAALNASSADMRHGLHNENKLQAYYLAKSGAQTLAEYIINLSYHSDFDEMDQFLDRISNNMSDEAFVKDGSLRIKTIRHELDGQDILDIISTGYYKGVSETVTLSLMVSVESFAKDYLPNPQEDALVILSDESGTVLELTNGAFLKGDVIVNAHNEDSIKFRGGSDFNIREGALYIPQGVDPRYVIDTDRGSNNGDAPDEYRIPDAPSYQWFSNWAFWTNIQNGVRYFEGSTYPSISYPELVFPDYSGLSCLPVPENPDFTTPQSDVNYTIDQDGWYNSIKPSSSRTIYIDMAGGDRIIRVGTLDLTGGNIELINIGESSRLKIYVDNSFALGSSRTLNANGMPDNVQIYIAGAQTVMIDGSSRFSGNIFVKQAIVSLTAGANMKGNIVSLGTKINVTGGSAAHGMILYAPNALVEMGGSAQILGSVIVKTFKRSGGGNYGIVFTPVENCIPGEFFSTGSNSLTVKYADIPWR